MGSEALACVSVDLDTLPHYLRIHGLPSSLLDPHAPDPVYGAALSRLLELFHRTGTPMTLFAIGEDSGRPEASLALAAACGPRVEVGNHSHRHRYDLSRLSLEEVEREVEEAEEAIRLATGERPVGFRAPGYTLSSTLYQALVRRGYRYDASVFPAAPYYLAKAGVLLGMRVLGRPSGAILDRPAVLAAPRRPYRPDPEDPYRRGEGPVLELPMTVVPWLRLPFFGTGVTASPGWVTRALYATLRRERFVSLELHAIDALDLSDKAPGALAPRQPGLAIPARQKLARLEEVLRALGNDFQRTTLREAATQLAG